MFKKILVFLLASFVIAPLAIAQTTLSCGSDGYSSMCMVNPDPLQQLQQDQQQILEQQQQLEQMQVICSAAGMVLSNGQCISHDSFCQQKYGLDSNYSSTETNGTIDCGCKSGFTWNQNQSSCVIPPAQQLALSNSIAGAMCILDHGSNSYYSGTSNNSGGCDCNIGFVWNQTHSSCIACPAGSEAVNGQCADDSNAATTNTAPQVAGVQTSIPNSATDPIGTNVKISDGTIDLIATDGTRRPYTSAGAFLSYGFNSWANVVDANSADMGLPIGTFIAPRDGTIFCATETKGTDVKGECALITGGQKASFTSSAVFTGLGFSFANAIYGDSSFLAKTSDIDNVTDAHRPGVLIYNNAYKSGSIELVEAAGLLNFINADFSTFNSWNYSFTDAVTANAADKALSQVGTISARQPGQLEPQ